MKTLQLLLILSTLGALSACAPAAIVTTGAVGVTAAEERSVGEVIDDAVITTTIKKEYARHGWSNLFNKISVDTTEGRVLLTGSLPTHAHISKAVSIAKSVAGVREVLNELDLANKSVGTRVDDRVIATQIRGRLLADKNVQFRNYSIDVNHGVAFVTGIAQNETELERVLKITSEVQGVAKVVSHATVKPRP